MASPRPVIQVRQSKCQVLNAGGFNPGAGSNTRWKRDVLYQEILAQRERGIITPFIGITESWLKEYHADAQIQLPGYQCVRADRQQRQGGGALLYVDEQIPIGRSDSFDDGICEAVFCHLPACSTNIAVVYRPPDAPFSSFSAALQFLRRNLDSDPDTDLFITGDFNFPMINWESMSVGGRSADNTKSAQHLLEFMEQYFLEQMVNTPTRGRNILDLFLTNKVSLVGDVKVEGTDLSDHNVINVGLTFHPTHPQRRCRAKLEGFRALDWHNGDYDLLREELGKIDWVTLRQDSDFQSFPEIFTKAVLNACQKVFQVVKAPRGKPNCFKKLQRRKTKTRARAKALRDKGQFAAADEADEALAKICLEIKDLALSRRDRREKKAIEKIKSDPRYFFSFAKSFLKGKSSIPLIQRKDGSTATDSKQIADVFQEQFCSVFSDPNNPDVKEPTFSPPELTFLDEGLVLKDEDIIKVCKDLEITSSPGPDGLPAKILKECANVLVVPLGLMWRESLQLKKVPEYYKLGLVTPLYKKGDRSSPKNYRPVTLTSHVAKLFERIMRAHMVDHFERNGIFSSKQHGFRAGRSCLTQLLGHIDWVLQTLCGGKEVDTVYLDYSRAFDKVDIRLLLGKMKRYGVHPDIVEWLESFLTGRKQKVVLDGSQSEIAIIISGVPQGSVLAPLLFLIFINDLEGVVEDSILSFFADDSRAAKDIAAEDDMEKLQADLTRVMDWSTRNNMVLNEEKYELLSHRPSSGNDGQDLPMTGVEYITSSGLQITPVDSVRDLGVTVCSDLSWRPHIVSLAKKGRCMAQWVFGVFSGRGPELMITVYKTLVRSLMEYCSPLWSPQAVGDIQLLESVQRGFTAKIAGMKDLDYWQRLKALDLMSLQRRRDRYAILHMHKVFCGLAPNETGVKFYPTSRHGTKAEIPDLSRVKSKRISSLYSSSFGSIGPKLWNCLPKDLREIQDPGLFKAELDCLLREIPDLPPTPGYPAPNRNMLPEWCVGAEHTKRWSPYMG